MPLSTKPKCITNFKTNTHPITCLAVHGTILYAASSNTINVFDLSTNTHIDSFNDDGASSGSVKSIAFHTTKKHQIFTAHQDGKIRIWHVTPTSKRHRLVSTLPTVKDRLIRSVLPKNHVHVRRHKTSLWIEHNDTVSGLAVNEGFVYSASWDKSFKIWDLRESKCLESVEAHNDAVNAVVVSEDGIVYTGSSDGFIRVWERDHRVRRHALVLTLDKHRSAVNALALNGDGTVLFSGGCDCFIMVWEREHNVNGDGDGDCNCQVGFVEVLLGHGGAVLCLMNVEDLLVSGSSDRTVRIWTRGEQGKGGYCCVYVIDDHEKPVKSLAGFSTCSCVQNGGVFVCICSGSLDGEIKIWGINIETFGD